MKISQTLTLCLLLPVFGLGLVAHAEESADAHAMVITDGVEMGKFTHDYEAAMAYAVEIDLPVMLVFTGSDWCGWCKLMDKEVFAKPEWSEYAKETIVQVWLDFPRDKALVPEKYRDQNDALKSKYGIRGYPTYIILDSSGNQVGRLGAGRDKTPASFSAELDKVLIMTASGMKAYAGKMQAEDAAKVMSAFDTYNAANSKVAALEERLALAKEEAAEAKAVLDNVMEASKVNALSGEDKAKYAEAQETLADAAAALESWMKKNARTKQTPELREEYEGLKKAVDAAQESVDSFDL